MAATARPVPMMLMAMPASPQNSSSLMMQPERPVVSLYEFARKSKLYRPTLAAS
jgi:hypothetical protein